MADGPVFVVQAFRRRRSGLTPTEAYVAASESAMARRGRAMSGRVDGMVFYKIETGADGDIWTRVELLASDGDVPEEAA